MSYRDLDRFEADRFRGPDRTGERDRMTFSEQVRQSELIALEAATRMALNKPTSDQLQVSTEADFLLDDAVDACAADRDCDAAGEELAEEQFDEQFYGRKPQ